MNKLLELLKRYWPVLAVPGGIVIWTLVMQLVETSPEHMPVMTDDPKASYVLRVQTGWQGQEGRRTESGLPWSTPVITVVIRNFDRWLLVKALTDPGLLAGSDLAREDVQIILARGEAKPAAGAGATPAAAAPAARTAEGDALRQVKFNQWFRRQTAALRLNVAGTVFESIAPVDPLRTGRTQGDDTVTRLVYVLNPKNSDIAEWNDLIRLYGSQYAGPVSLSLLVGEKAAYHLDTQVNSDDGQYPQIYALPLRPRVVRGMAWAGLFAILGLMLATSVNTGALRTPLEEGQGSWRDCQWSISRVILAWWLTLCTASYLFLWAMTGEYNVLSKTALVLLGINGATLLAATTMTRRLSPENAVGAAPATPKNTRGFFTDLISEGGDAEISRVQMLVWNVVLGLIFIWETLADWKMPEFDTVQMTLLGISSTAYVGYKLVPPPANPGRQPASDRGGAAGGGGQSPE